MGWTSYRATHYTKGGKIDRKAECDNVIGYDEEFRSCKVLKSTMKGSVYYAAVEFTDKRAGKSEVFAAIFLTRTYMQDHFNFSYKDMYETMGPYAYDCPKGILDLLTETDNEYANEWRKKCREKLAKKKAGQNLSKLPIDTVIEIDWYGEKLRLRKMEPNFQFKTTWWYDIDSGKYMPKKRLSGIDFTVIAAPA